MCKTEFLFFFNVFRLDAKMRDCCHFNRGTVYEKVISVLFADFLTLYGLVCKRFLELTRKNFKNFQLF